MKKSLLLGCGNSREKKVYLDGQKEWAGELVTLDINPNCGADVVMQIGQFVPPLDGSDYLPFSNEEFDEIGAYDCLEHWGCQGDWRGWFSEFAEYHRILKPGGTMGLLVPIGNEALADPGHTRFIQANHFRMLDRQFYADCLDKGLPVTDYRWVFSYHFDILHLENIGGHHLAVLLRKPA